MFNTFGVNRVGFNQVRLVSAPIPPAVGIKLSQILTETSPFAQVLTETSALSQTLYED